MVIGLLIILLLVLTLPFLLKQVEHNLEPFLFIMGLAATIVSGVLGKELLIEILENHFMYMITGAVLIAGLLFKIWKEKVQGAVAAILKYVPLKVFIFFITVTLGLFSSVITAIIASLVLVEIISVLPLSRKDKVNLDIIACFSIGLGAALTPIGEPLSTITVSKLNAGFWYLLGEVGWFIIPGVLATGLFGAYYVARGRPAKGDVVIKAPEQVESLPTVTRVAGRNEGRDQDPAWQGGAFASPVAATAERAAVKEAEETVEKESYQGVVIRAVKIFVFVMALELLGAGFKPVIDTYVIYFDSRLLYWVNMISAVLDNATLAAAEISAKMTSQQIQAILMGLLISGGMLIPGNIPNIVSASKLKIGSREWACLGVPFGMALMIIYFVVLFLV
ncbi:MAG: DUF1646 family protein [Bacillota bacterium]